MWKVKKSSLKKILQFFSNELLIRLKWKLENLITRKFLRFSETLLIHILRAPELAKNC